MRALFSFGLLLFSVLLICSNVNALIYPDLFVVSDENGQSGHSSVNGVSNQVLVADGKYYSFFKDSSGKHMLMADSNDYGVSWSEPEIIYTTPTQIIAHYDVISDSENNFYLVHSTGNDYKIYFSYSTDYGVSWEPSELVCTGAFGSCFGTYGVVTLDVNGFESYISKRARILTQGYFWTRKTGSWVQTGSLSNIKGRMFLDEIDKNIYAWGSTSASGWYFSVSSNDGANWSTYPKISGLDSHRTNHSRTDRNILGTAIEGSNLIFNVFMPDSNSFLGEKTVFTGSFGFFEGFDDNVNNKYLVFFAGKGSDENRIFHYEADYNGSDFSLVEIYDLGLPVKNFRIVKDISRLGIIADVNNNGVFQKLYFRIPPAKLTITNPTEGMIFNQREPINVTFQIKDTSNNHVTYLTIARFKMKEDGEWYVTTINWNQEYSFTHNAPNETGEHTLTIKALVDGQWIQSYVNYTVEPYDIDLKINFIKVIQVVEDVNLVAGKETAVKVEVNNTNDLNREYSVTVRLLFNDQNYFDLSTFLGDSNFIFYVDDPYQSQGDYNITAEVDWIKQFEESDENNNFMQDYLHFDEELPTLKLIFYPIDMDKKNYKLFKEQSQIISEYLYATYPVSPLNYEVEFKENVLDSSKLKCQSHIFACVMKNITQGTNVDSNFVKIIGVVPSGWFGEKDSRYSSTDGIASPKFIGTILTASTIQTSAAHEIGHNYGLCDEYNDTCGNCGHSCDACPNKAPGGCGTLCPDNNAACYGSITPHMYLVKNEIEKWSVDQNIRNPENLFSFMGSSNFQSNRGATEDVFDHLWDFFYEHRTETMMRAGDSNNLIITGFLDINYNVTLEPFYITELVYDTYGSSECEARSIDSNESVLFSKSFPVSFVTFSNPPVDLNESSFYFTIPYSEDINSVRIYCNDELKAERFVSANAPTVSITSPTGEEEWSTGEHTIMWTANDSDGDELHYALQYSDNNGLIWDGLIIDLNQTDFNLDVGMFDGGSSYKIKVIATDGILTTEDISSTFTILNPDINVVPKDWDLGTINDLQNVSQDFNIINSGNADLNVFDVNYSEDLNVTGLSLPIVLEPGEGHVFSVELEVLDMDLGEFVRDINLGSNDPNQIVERIEVYGEIDEAKPDFRITAENISFNPVYPEEDQNIVISALVENLGDLNASNVGVLFYGKGVAPFVLDVNTVALYRSESGSGTTLVDETGNHNGSFKASGEPEWDTNSRFGEYSLNFDGSDDYVSVPDHNELDLTGELTVEFWFYSNGWSNWDGLIAKSNYGGDNTTNYGLNTNGSIFQWYFREVGGSWRILTFSAPTALEWHHFMGTFKQVNPTTVEAKAFIDGVLQTDSNLSGDLSNAVNSHDLIIGSTDVSGQPFDGLIDEIRISNKVRKPYEFILGEKIISFIDANSGELVSVDWNSVKAGDYNIFVVIDDKNLFDERDETNNSDYNSVTVYSDPILSIEFEFDALNDLGEPFDLNVIVENIGAKLLDANATLILPAELSTTDSLTKTIGDLNSHDFIKVEWQDINSSDSGMFEITVRVQATNADENISAYTSIRHIELEDLNLTESIYPDEIELGTFEVTNFNPSTSYAGLYYNIDINGAENYSYDENVGLLHASETKQFEIEWNQWKQADDYNLTVSLYDVFDELIDQKQGSFEVIPYKPSMLTYYSTDGLEFNPEFTSYADYFSSASDENQQVMVVYSYNGDLNYSIRNPFLQEWSSPVTIGSGNYPYLVGDGNDFHLVYVDENVYYRKYSSGAWNSAELVSVMSSVDPVLTFDGSILYALFSSEVNGLFNVFLAGFNGSWNTEIELTHCLDTNCSNPIVLDEGLIDGKLSYAYRKFKGEEYSTLDSNLMYSLFDVNYFYWGS